MYGCTTIIYHFWTQCSKKSAEYSTKDYINEHCSNCQFPSKCGSAFQVSVGQQDETLDDWYDNNSYKN